MGVRRIGRAAAAGLVVTLPFLRAPSPALADGGPDSASIAIARVLELTNLERQKAGLAPLTLSPQLSRAAQRYSEVLSNDACFAHTCGCVPEITQRVSQSGYDSWTAVGENIAAGYSTPEAVVAGWMSSPGHRANILSPKYRELGLGIAAGGNFGTYWTEDFGSRPGGASRAFQPLLAPAADAVTIDDEGGADE